MYKLRMLQLIKIKFTLKLSGTCPASVHTDGFTVLTALFHTEIVDISYGGYID